MGIIFIGAKHFRRGRGEILADGRRVAIKPILVVLHSTESKLVPGGARRVARYFAETEKKVSAHYIVDREEVVQCVLERDVAFHAGLINRFSIGIEHVGYARWTREEWMREEGMLRRGAGLLAEVARRWGIPLVGVSSEELARGLRPGVTRHMDVAKAGRYGTNHSDPGEGFPLEEYLGWAREEFERLSKCGP